MAKGKITMKCWGCGAQREVEEGTLMARCPTPKCGILMDVLDKANQPKRRLSGAREGTP